MAPSFLLKSASQELSHASMLGVKLPTAISVLQERTDLVPQRDGLPRQPQRRRHECDRHLRYALARFAMRVTETIISSSSIE